MRDALGGVLKAMDGARFQGRPAMSLRRAQQTLDVGQATAAATDLGARLVAKGECPACVHAREMEAGYLTTLGEQLLGEEGLLQAYRASDGLCLPHLRSALAKAADEETARCLVEVAASKLTPLLADLGEYVRKHDWNNRHEPKLLWGGFLDPCSGCTLRRGARGTRGGGLLAPPKGPDQVSYTGQWAGGGAVGRGGQG